MTGNVRGLTFACTAPIIGWSSNSHLLPAAGEMVKEFHIGEARLLPSMIRSEKTFKPKSNNWSKVDQKAALSPGDDDRWWCQYMVGTAIGDAILLELSVSAALKSGPCSSIKLVTRTCAKNYMTYQEDKS